MFTPEAPALAGSSSPFYEIWVGELRSLLESDFDLPIEPIIPPGGSPFRTKGIAYKGVFDFAEANVPGGRDALLATLQPNLRHFSEQRFSSSSWYDCMPIPFLARSMAELRGVSFRHQLIDSNRFVASGPIGRLYDSLLKVVSAQLLAIAIPRAATIIHDFGRATSRIHGPQCVMGERTGIPKTLARWIAFSTSAYMEELLARSGATAPRVEFQGARPSGEQAGEPLYDLLFEITWS